MKKLIVLTAALLVLALIGVCVAEEQTEIEGRVLREGKYIIGEDIEAGTYTLICIATAGEQMNDALAKLYEDRGKLGMLKQLQPEALEDMRARAVAENTDASLRIDGLYLDTARVRALAAGGKPAGDLEAQAAGYAKALRGLAEGAAAKDLSTVTILCFYESMYGHRGLGTKSRYRKKDFMYVQVDGHAQAMPVSPITAFETPLVLGGACDSLAEAFDADPRRALILSAVFTVDFLCIRPFDEGNGRISRLFAELMLAKAGFDVASFESLDRVIEGRAMEYYDALNGCVERWDRGGNTYEPYVRYWLDVVHEAYSRLFARLDVARAGTKGERIEACVRNAGGPITKRQLLEANPDVSEAMVENVLGRMVREGSAAKVGAGRSTAYVAC